MRVVRHFPDKVRVIENEWIPMSDGVRLAARIWLPETAEERPVPAILEYMPYRKRDFTRLRDEPLHHYFAGHGYASIRLDLRGTGDSGGLLHDEYLKEEHDDAVDAIAWIASQPWCTGAVGMTGLSWGGFNALQIAARRPPALKAIITLCSTDDRYADDAHYKGGCLLNENLTWGSQFMQVTACPPDPEIVGAGWRDEWLARLENARLFPAVWLHHQHRDAYWRHGSVCEDYEAITCAVYAIGGWADGYPNAIPRLMQGLTCPKKALIGPWSHASPQVGVPGPAIGYFQEAVRWWNHWLKGQDTGIMDEPPIRVWMEEWAAPDPRPIDRPGRWVAEDRWPSPRVTPERLFLNLHSLDAAATGEDARTVCSPQTTGLNGAEWYGFGAEGEAPLDQRGDDGRSLLFDSAPLEERLEILGAPVVTLDLSADKPVAYVIVRLTDVAPDGTSARVSYAVLNLTHRDGHEAPQALEPGRRYRVPVRLNDIAYAFPAGHKIRLAVSTVYWPMLWPPPEPVHLTVHTGVSTCELPVRPPSAADAGLRPFEPPERGPRAVYTPLRMAEGQRLIERDLTTNEVVYTILGGGGEFGGADVAHIEEIDLTVGYTIRRTFRIGETDPTSARASVEQKTRLDRKDWSIRIELQTALSATPTHFRVEGTLEAFEGADRIFRRTWDEHISRELV